MRKGVWFGIEGDMGWVPAPLSGGQGGPVRWRAVDEMLNGGAVVRQSAASHRRFSLSWAVQSMEGLDRLYRVLNSRGPFYYVDPFAAQHNAIPPYWASPATWMFGGPPLVNGLEPTLVAGNVVNNYPAESVRFTTTKSVRTNIVLPVPEGYTLHLGVHGSGGRYRLNSGNHVAPLAPSNTTRTNLTLNGPTFATLWVDGAHTCTVAGIIAQILPVGETPKQGGFLSGMGQTALQLADDPMFTDYSAALSNAQKGVAADFVEVGAWTV